MKPLFLHFSVEKYQQFIYIKIGQLNKKTNVAKTSTDEWANWYSSRVSLIISF